jgi:hypothetical protein
MRSLRSFLVCGLFLMLLSSAVKADLTDDYNINIYDHNSPNIPSLYQLFNDYFAAELGDNKYTSSNALFNALGVDPHSQWKTSGTSLVGAYANSAMQHELNVVDMNGNELGQILNLSEYGNSVNGDRIGDISGSVTNIPDGININLQLAPRYGDIFDNENSIIGPDYQWVWSSDPSKNEYPEGTLFKDDAIFAGDGSIHMLALNITDLYNQKYGTDFESVYMFAWEDLSDLVNGHWLPADYDFQDFVGIMTNLTPTAAAPEPASMLILLVGGGVSSLYVFGKRRREKKAK